MTAAPLSIAQVAAELGLSTRQFRRVWASYVQRRSFPAPFRRPPESNFAWDAEAVREWKRRRALAGLGDGAVTPANDAVHPADALPYGARVAIPAFAASERSARDEARFRREHSQLLRQIRGA